MYQEAIVTILYSMSINLYWWNWHNLGNHQVQFQHPLQQNLKESEMNMKNEEDREALIPARFSIVEAESSACSRASEKQSVTLAPSRGLPTRFDGGGGERGRERRRGSSVEETANCQAFWR